MRLTIPIASANGKSAPTESARDFSAVGCFFGKDIHRTIKMPVGLIGTYWGGTHAHSWASL